jgi:hypothetical protein
VLRTANTNLSLRRRRGKPIAAMRNIAKHDGDALNLSRETHDLRLAAHPAEEHAASSAQRFIGAETLPSRISEQDASSCLRGQDHRPDHGPRFDRAAQCCAETVQTRGEAAIVELSNGECGSQDGSRTDDAADLRRSHWVRRGRP